MTPARGCAFCQQTRKLGQEHYLAEHWRGKFGQPLSGPTGYHHWDVDSGRNKTGVREKLHFSEKGGTVCEGCNSGWMSRLEAAVTPLISAAAWPGPDGPTISPSQAERETLLRWAAKTSIVMEEGHDGAKLTPRSLISAVQNDETLEGFHAWMRPLWPCPVWGKGTRDAVVPIEGRSHHVRLSLFSISRCLVVTMHGSEGDADWWSAVEPKCWLGPELVEAAHLPTGTNVPSDGGPFALRPIKERIHVRMLRRVGVDPYVDPPGN